MIGKALSEPNPNLNLFNTPENIVKSVLELVKNEMKISLENCKLNDCSFQTLTHSIFDSMRNKYPNDCNVNLINGDYCGEYQTAYQNAFVLNFNGFRIMFSCYKSFI